MGDIESTRMKEEIEGLLEESVVRTSWNGYTIIRDGLWNVMENEPERFHNSLHIWGLFEKIKDERKFLESGKHLPEYWVNKYYIPCHTPIPYRLQEHHQNKTDSLEIPLEWFARLPKALESIEVMIPQGLVTHIGKAWESSEWADHYWNTSKKKNSSQKTFTDAIAYLYGCSMVNGGYLYLNVVKQIYNSDNVDRFLDLLERVWTSKTEHFECWLASYERSGTTKSGNKVEWNPFLTQQRLVKHTITSKPVVRTFNNFNQKRCHEMGENRILFGEFTNWMELDILDHEQVRTNLLKLVESEYKHEDEKQLVDIPIPVDPKEHKALQEKYTLVDDWMNLYDYWITQPCFYSNNLDRHYTPSIQMPSVIRSMFTRKGKHLAWVDVASMHPTILLMEYLPYASETEKKVIDLILYKDVAGNGRVSPKDNLMFMGRVCGLEFDPIRFKEENLTYYNAPANETESMTPNIIYRALLPGFAHWLEAIKTRTPMKHETVSKFLLAKEASIMEEVLLKVWEKGIFGINAHDGVDCDPNRISEVIDIFREVFAKRGLPCNLSVKSSQG